MIPKHGNTVFSNDGDTVFTKSDYQKVDLHQMNLKMTDALKTQCGSDPFLTSVVLRLGSEDQGCFFNVDLP